MKILIVEDNFINRFVMQKMLLKYGECDSVVNGKEAVDAYTIAFEESKPYDYIFLDIMMPEMDGREALKIIRAKEKESGVPPKDETKIIIVDFHAETTAEKIAFAWYADGKASGIFGTHTHIQTADERILPQGTAYITDAGMTGPYDSVIGMKKESSIKRFVYATPQKHEVATDDIRFAGVVCEISPETGKAILIKRIFFPEF